MARTYKRDANGRFSGSGGGSKGGKGGKGAKAAAGGPPPPPPGLSKTQWAKVNSASGKPSNKVSSSPRRLSKAERDYLDITAQRSKFRSDSKVREEMKRRGHFKGSKDVQGDLIKLSGTVNSKIGANSWKGKTTDLATIAKTQKAAVAKAAKAYGVGSKRKRS